MRLPECDFEGIRARFSITRRRCRGRKAAAPRRGSLRGAGRAAVVRGADGTRSASDRATRHDRPRTRRSPRPPVERAARGTIERATRRARHAVQGRGDPRERVAGLRRSLERRNEERVRVLGSGATQEGEMRRRLRGDRVRRRRQEEMRRRRVRGDRSVVGVSWRPRPSGRFDRHGECVGLAGARRSPIRSNLTDPRRAMRGHEVAPHALVLFPAARRALGHASTCARKRSCRRSIRRRWILQTRDSERFISSPISRIEKSSQYFR